MKKILICATLVASLAGCTTLGTIGQKVCDNYMVTRMALLGARAQAMLIDDATKRNAAVTSIDISLAVLERCDAAR